MSISIHDINVTVFRSKDFTLSGFDLLGATCFERVSKATINCVESFTSPDLAALQSYPKTKKYGLFLSEQFPLFDSQLLDEILDYYSVLNEIALRFEGGILFDTERIDSVKSLSSIRFNKFDEEKVIRLTEKTLPYIYNKLKNRIIDRHIQAGVIIPQPDTVYIDEKSVIGSKTVIYMGTVMSNSRVGKNCTVNAGSTLENCDIKDNCEITSSVLKTSTVKSNAKIGPFSFLRPHSVIGENCKIGDFVEIKNSIIGDRTKISHLAYVGDAEVGSDCNIGCGVVFCNYNGKTKNKTSVGDKVFVGSNCNLVAPLSVGDGSFLAAGTTVTEDVPPFSLCIGRSRQTIKGDWSKEYFC